MFWSQKFDGGLYYWDTSAGLSSNAAATTNVSAGPTKSRFMLVSGDDRHVICLGTETTIADTSTQDNMFVRWSHQETTNTWTPTATNTAGTHRLTAGNQINMAVRSRGAILNLDGYSFVSNAVYWCSFYFWI
jgi:general stress protein 26